MYYISGRPHAAKIVSPPLSYFKDQYNLTWTVDSFLPIEEYRILYRVFSVSESNARVHACTVFPKQKNFWKCFLRIIFLANKKKIHDNIFDRRIKKNLFYFPVEKKTLFIRKTLKLQKYRIIMYHFRFSPATCLRHPELRLLLLSLPAPAPAEILRRSLKQPQTEQAAPPAAQFCFCLRDGLDKHHTHHLGQEAEVQK